MKEKGTEAQCGSKGGVQGAELEAAAPTAKQRQAQTLKQQGARGAFSRGTASGGGAQPANNA